MKVDGSLKSLLQGVSQQPPRDRLPGQCSVQDNMSSDPVSGLTRRPPTDLVGSLGTGTAVRGWHTFTAKDGQKFLVWFHDGTVQVYDLNTNEQVVDIDALAIPYLTLDGKMRCSTDEDDLTIVVNNAAVPSMTSAVPTYFNNGTDLFAAVVQILGGSYGKAYKIYADGVAIASFTTPDGSVAAHTAQIDTTYIATQLYNAIPVGYTKYIKEDVITITKATAWTATASDGFGNLNIKVMNDSVPKTEDLPRIAPHLYIVRVAEKTDPEKDLWFKFIVDEQKDNLVPSAAHFGKSGYWQESVARDTQFEFSLDTMPHVLDYADGEFSFSQGPWEPREVGTVVSNPPPSFIGNKIKDLTSFQGRLALIAGSNVIMSRTNRPFNMWYGSASAAADTDPVDINSSVEASNMESLVQHNRDLVVFSKTAQFIVFGRTKVTGSNAALVLTTRFESEDSAHPVGAGRNVFFAANYGRYSAIREFFAEGNTDINDSRPITQHIKRYILGTATHLSTSSNYDTLVVHTDTEQEKMYVYQYIWADSEKVQSSWNMWYGVHPIVYSFFDEDRVYFVQKVGTEYLLLRMPLDVQTSDGMQYPVYLDQRFDVFDVNSAFILPFDYMKDDPLLCVQGANCPNPGMLAPIQSITYDLENSGWRVTLKKDMLGGDIIVGSRFMSRYAPTMPTVKDSDGVVVGTGKMLLTKFMLALYQTGEVIGQVMSRYGNSEPVRFNGRTVGDINNIVGEQPLSDGKFVMPVRSNADEAEVMFYTDSHLPWTTLDIEWQGQYSKRGRRITGGGG